MLSREVTKSQIEELEVPKPSSQDQGSRVRLQFQREPHGVHVKSLFKKDSENVVFGLRLAGKKMKPAGDRKSGRSKRLTHLWTQRRL